MEQNKKPPFTIQIKSGQPYLVLSSGRLIPMMGYGSSRAEEGCDLASILEHAVLEVGYRHIDTASSYQNEEIIGQAISRILKSGKVKREELFITSKIWHTEKDDVEGAVKRSLSKLGIDYLDLYLVHWPSPGFDETTKEIKRRPLHKVWAEMEKLVKKGLVKDIGVSNFNAQTLLDLMNYAEMPPVINQIELNPYIQQRKLVDYFQRTYQLGFTSFGPIARAGGHRYEGRTLAEEKVFQELAAKYKKSVYQIALRWGIERGHVVIPKTSTLSRLQENFDPVSFSLEPEDMQKIEALDCNFRGQDCKTREFMQCIPLFD